MTFNHLPNQLPKELLKLIQFVDHFGFDVALIGGWVRDYLLTNTISHDFDIELRPKDELSNFLSLYEELVEVLEKTYEVEHLAYNVTKIVFDDFEAELTLPRLEKYNDDLHHSNFEASFIADLDYTQGFKRRDFTINAICLVFNENNFTLIDPLGGHKDLKDKKLRPCSDDFYKDPVRYLRAIRFAIKLGFTIDPAIEAAFSNLQIAAFSSHYLKLEAKKSGRPIAFFNKFFNYFEMEQAEHPLIDEYENQFCDLTIEDFFKNNLFLSPKFLQNISQLTGISLKPQLLVELKFRFLAKGEYNYSEALSLAVKSFRHLSKLKAEVQNFYFKHQLTDLDHSAIEKILNTKIDVSAVEPRERSEFELFYKLKELVGGN